MIKNGIRKKRIIRGIATRRNIIQNKRKIVIDEYRKNNHFPSFEVLNIIEMLYNSMNNIPCDCFQLIKNYSGYTIEQLYQDSGISEATIKRYFYDQYKKRYKKNTIINFLLFTNCPYCVSLRMLEVCKCKLNTTTKNDMFYKSILENRWYYDYKENLIFIEEYFNKF